MSRNRRALPLQSQPTSLDRKNPRHLLRGHLRPGRGIVESPDSRAERHSGEAAFSASLRLAPSLHIRLSRSPCAIARVFILLPSYFILFFIRYQSKIQHSKFSYPSIPPVAVPAIPLSLQRHKCSMNLQFNKPQN